MTVTQLPPGDGGSLDLSPDDAFARAVLGMRAELAAVADSATFGLSDQEVTALFREVTGVASGLAELQARLVAEADARDLAKEAGCASTTAWVRVTTGL